MQRGVGFASFCVGAWLGCLGVTGCARKAPAVLCTCSYGGVEQRLTFPATRDPYGVKAVDVAGRFRFKAIYLREPWRAASVNVYAYHQAEERDVLLQEGKYLPPFAAAASGGRYGFTGRQLVYSPTERELEYWCELSP
jgi:hypothetical protein